MNTNDVLEILRGEKSLGMGEKKTGFAKIA